jgi:hypothetical protein
MDTCFLCVEETSIFLVSGKCDCKIYIHIECMEKWIENQNARKCMICKTCLSDKNNKNKNDINDIPEYIKKFLDMFTIVSESNLVLFLVFSFFVTLFILLPLFVIMCIRVIKHGDPKKSKYIYDVYNVYDVNDSV